MSVRLLIPISLLLLCAVITGCGTAPEPKTEAEKPATKATAKFPLPREAAEDKAAADKKAAEEKAVAGKKATEEKAAADKKAAEEKETAEKKAGQEKAAANSSVKVKVEVELRGVLSCNGEAITITITERSEKFVGFVLGKGGSQDVRAKSEPDFREIKWELDFSEDKDLRAKAKGLDGKTVLAKGSATLRGITSDSETEYEGRSEREIETGPGRVGRPRELRGIRTTSVLDLEPKLAVKGSW